MLRLADSAFLAGYKAREEGQPLANYLGLGAEGSYLDGWIKGWEACDAEQHDIEEQSQAA